MTVIVLFFDTMGDIAGPQEGNIENLGIVGRAVLKKKTAFTLVC